MTTGSNDCHTARWSHGQPDMLVITDMAGTIVDSHPAHPAGGHPGPRMLWDTGWMAYPSAEWQEDPPGQWSRAVFPGSGPGRKR